MTKKAPNQDISIIEKQLQILLPFITESRWNRIVEIVENRTYNVVPVLEHIYDSGNTSAVMRSAEAFGFSKFHIIERPDGQFKHSTRVSQGTEKWLQIKRHKDSLRCLREFKERGFKIYATHLEATIKIENINWSHPSAIIFGNEKDGVSQEALSLCDEKFLIPMYGFAQSFNISVAAALCFQFIHQSRVSTWGKSGDLNPSEKTEMLFDYVYKSIKEPDKILRSISGSNFNP